MHAAEEFAPEIERVRRLLGSVARRRCLGPDEAEDFESWAIVRILENDCRILRGFSGRSSIGTYLRVVVTNLFRDYRIHKWGKWRPSAAAKRLGPDALLLEQLVVRDKIPEGEAFGRLRENHGVELDDRELEELLTQIPRRSGRPRAVEAETEGFSGGPAADTAVREAELTAVADRAGDALAAALASLEPQDRLLLKMRFDDGFSIAEISRLTGLEAKPLYPRFQRLFAVLRRELERAACDRDQIERLWRWRGGDVQVVYDVESDAGAEKTAGASVGMNRDPRGPGWRQ